MGRLTELLATVADPVQDKHRYAYLSVKTSKNRRIIKKMRRRQAELDKLIKIQASEMKNEKLCRMCGD